MKAIYNPSGQAQEYGEWASNPYRGCGHKCAYCYVPSVLHMPRDEFDKGAVLRDGFIEAFERDAKKMFDNGIGVNIFFCFTTDMYHPGDNTPSRKVLELTQKYGHSFTVLTKGGLRSLRDLDLYRPGLDYYAATLTSLDDNVSAKWERGADCSSNRIIALQLFKKADIFTWVSLEPTLDTNASLEILWKTHEFVDFYKIGRVNYLPMTKTTDWKAYTLAMLDAVQKLGIRAYFKKDLQEYLPAGCANEPLRP